MHAIRADHDIEPLLRSASEANVYSGAIIVQRFDGVIEPVADLPVAREIVQNRSHFAARQLNVTAAAPPATVIVGFGARIPSDARRERLA